MVSSIYIQNTLYRTLSVQEQSMDETTQEAHLTQGELIVLDKLEATFEYIKRDYPNASRAYKLSSFVIGAQDLAMQFVSDAEFPVKRLFARRIDELRVKVFGEHNNDNDVIVPGPKDEIRRTGGVINSPDELDQ